MSTEMSPMRTVVEILAAGATHTSGKLRCTLYRETKQFLLPFVVAGGTDAIFFAPGSDADAAAAAGRDPLAPNSDFLLPVQCL